MPACNWKNRTFAENGMDRLGADLDAKLHRLQVVQHFALTFHLRLHSAQRVLQLVANGWRQGPHWCIFPNWQLVPWFCPQSGLFQAAPHIFVEHWIRHLAKIGFKKFCKPLMRSLANSWGGDLTWRRNCQREKFCWEKYWTKLDEIFCLVGKILDTHLKRSEKILDKKSRELIFRKSIGILINASFEKWFRRKYDWFDCG